MITEGLKHKDLDGLIHNTFTIDRYRSKMGEDRKIVVLGFKIKDKYPAIDVMEFIEKGYPFVLDADISSGEEIGGQYSVFVEIQRDKNIFKHINKIINGLDNLTDIDVWKFKYYKDLSSLEFNEENINQKVPQSPEEYDVKVLQKREEDINQFFNQGAVESIDLDLENNLSFNKPFSESIKFKLIDYGSYRTLKESLKGKIQLDERSQCQTLFLEKYLGNYEIHKIDDKFLIKNNNQAIILEKIDWK